MNSENPEMKACGNWPGMLMLRELSLSTKTSNSYPWPKT